ncbi:inositol monophosphatase family protein [Kribbella qitaiheensis]|uniref:inositol monophosphatase family protein n=1 Tax=Kribbella qitaiheensis TaxID=1544730 RepID=UPI001FE51590|nr:inositol monophosphatase family protein [Kribbella qitaiheensis]
MNIEFKRDQHDPVTEHDRRAEEAITKSLTANVPGSSIVGEEDGAHQGTGDVTWYVDPIDGTANFARGLAFFCTSIGAVVDGRIVAGAILDPMSGDLFTADLSGAWHNGSPIRSTGYRDEAEAFIITGYPSARDVATDGAEGLARFGDLATSYGTLRRSGSAALSLAHVGAGWIDAAMGTSVNAWDICAGRLIVEQAGGLYHGFGADGWNQPGYAAYTSDLNPVALNRFLTAYEATD